MRAILIKVLEKLIDAMSRPRKGVYDTVEEVRNLPAYDPFLDEEKNLSGENETFFT